MLRWKSSLKPAAAAPAADITLENSAVTTASSFASPLNIDVNIPTVSTNDILILLVTTNDYSEPTDSPPTDWNKIAEKDGSNSSASTVAAYWKRASSGASATTEEWSSFFPYGESYYIWVGAYSGCTTSGSPIDAYGTAAIPYSSTWSVNITTTVSNTMIVTISGSTNSSVTQTWSDGTELIDTSYQSQASVSINEKLESSSGAKTRTATASTPTSDTLIAVALKPPATTPAGDALILNGITSSSTGGVETTVETDGSSTVYGSYAIGDMHFRDASKNGSWTDDGFGLLWDQSTDGSNWQTLLGSTSGTFYIYEQGTTTLIFSYAWSGEGNFTSNTHRYGSTSVDFTGTVPAGSTRVDVYHVKD